MEHWRWSIGSGALVVLHVSKVSSIKLIRSVGSGASIVFQICLGFRHPELTDRLAIRSIVLHVSDTSTFERKWFSGESQHLGQSLRRKETSLHQRPHRILSEPEQWQTPTVA